MALTINPAVGGRHDKWLVDTITFSVGVFLGGLGSVAVVAAVVGSATLLLNDSAVITLLLLALGAAILRDVGLSVPLPYRSRQVPEWWREAMPMRLAAFAYGAMLGFGFATPFTSSAHLAFLIAVPLLPSISMVLLCVFLFALGKTLILQVAAGTATHSEVIDRISEVEATTMMRKLARRTVSVTGAAVVVLALLGQLPG